MSKLRTFLLVLVALVLTGFTCISMESYAAAKGSYYALIPCTTSSHLVFEATQMVQHPTTHRWYEYHMLCLGSGTGIVSSLGMRVPTNDIYSGSALSVYARY